MLSITPSPINVLNRSNRVGYQELQGNCVILDCLHQTPYLLFVHRMTVVLLPWILTHCGKFLPSLKKVLGLARGFYFSADNGFSFQVTEYLANFTTFRLLLPSERRIPKGFFERLLSACIIMGLFLCPRTDTMSPYCTESTAAYLHTGLKSPKSVQLQWVLESCGFELI